MVSKLARVPRRIPDAVDPDFYSRFEVWIPAPVPESAIPCVMVSVSTSPRRRLFFRLANLEAYDRAFRLTELERARLTAGLAQAHKIVAEIEDDLRRRYHSMLADFGEGPGDGH